MARKNKNAGQPNRSAQKDRREYRVAVRSEFRKVNNEKRNKK